MKAIDWKDGLVIAVDQTKLPHKLVYLHLKTPQEIVRAINILAIRGAPLLGAAAALTLAQTAYGSKTETKRQLLKQLEKTANLVRKTRPTAVNLFAALDRIVQKSRRYEGKANNFPDFVIKESLKVLREDAKANLALGLNGAKLIHNSDTVLTHCNAGELATVRYGTALGVIIAAHKQGKKVKVIATETRPLLQGARLTAYELKRHKIPVTLITDNMAGYVMSRGMVNKVIVGADRVMTTGHVANKIGTYTLAVLAKQHGIPFLVAAPTSTIDLYTPVGEVLIEQRSPLEVLEFETRRIAPRGVKALNPAFDITPPKLISAIITEKGTVPPRLREIRKLVG